jgi:hypothetical protein
MHVDARQRAVDFPRLPRFSSLFAVLFSPPFLFSRLRVFPRPRAERLMFSRRRLVLNLPLVIYSWNANSGESVFSR